MTIPNAAATERPGILSPLRRPKFRWLWFSQGLASCAQSGIPVALVFYLLTDVKAAVEYGILIASMSAATLCMILAGGVVADRFRRSRVMVAANLLRATGVAGLAVAGADDLLAIHILFAMMIGTGAAFHQPAQRSLVPELVDASQIRAANALQQVTGRIAMVLGPSIGGAAAIVFGAEGVLWTSSAIFALSCLSLIQIGDDQVTHKERTSVWLSAREGLGVMMRTPWLSAVITSGLIQVLLTVAPVIVLLPVVLTETGLRGHYGMLLSCQAIGSVFGSLLAARWRPDNPGIPAMIGPMMMSGQILCLLYSAPAALLAAAMIGAGFGTSLFIVYWISGIQTGVPRDLRSRVFSLDSVGANALQPLALAATIPISERIGIEFVLWVALAALILTSVAPLALADVRRLGPAPSGPEGEDGNANRCG